MIFISESVSRDSGLGFEAGGVDNITNGLNSMGLGGRGFPSYGNQGFLTRHLYIICNYHVEHF